MTEQQYQETNAELNNALSAWDWGRAEAAAHDLEALGDEQEPVAALRHVHVWYEEKRADKESLLPEECEQWYPYAAAYVARTPGGQYEWRCFHTPEQGNGPHTEVVSG